MSKLGIGDDDLVVAYDDAAGSIAARLWWMLRATGHAAAVLDGGIAAWNGDVEVGAGAMRPPRTFTPTSWPAHDVVDAHEVVALRNQGAVLVDARDAARYRGELEPIDPRAGHIPGARSAPWRGNIDPTSGQFRDTRELRERFGALGIDDASTVVAYCGSGITACHAILALEMAGLPAARLYEGSWSDWCSDPSRPAATGDESD